MRKLTVEVNCNKATCGECELLGPSYIGTADTRDKKCKAPFGLYRDDWGYLSTPYRRLPECLAAEKEAAK